MDEIALGDPRFVFDLRNGREPRPLTAARVRRFLEAALSADPGNVEARVALAEHELDRGHPERVLALLQPVLAQAEEAPRLALMQARALEALGEKARAHTLVEETFRRHADVPRVVRAAVSISPLPGGVMVSIAR